MFYSDLQCFTVIQLLQLAIACFQVLFLHENCMFSTQKRPEIVVSRVLEEVEHQVIMFDKYFTKKVNLKAFQACHSLVFMYSS